MPDMLVPLYKLPSSHDLIADLKEKGIVIRRANPWEITPTREFISRVFPGGWADEASVGFARCPVSTLIAIKEGRIIGFGSYDCTRRGIFGPTGVEDSHRKQGIGAALLLRCLEAMLEMGYAYAVIGGAGPTRFYEKACGATVIPGSVPGIYTDLLAKR
ncbi:MAG TPA: GNAT family N-acetyltransferase [Armatimonadota bacterium]|nr:GNAT family N-acetyltransferase [Armatimonadota bacterium]